MPKRKLPRATAKSVEIMVRVSPVLAAAIEKARKREGFDYTSQWMRSVVEKALTSADGYDMLGS